MTQPLTSEEAARIVAESMETIRRSLSRFSRVLALGGALVDLIDGDQAAAERALDRLDRDALAAVERAGDKLVNLANQRIERLDRASEG